MTALAPIVAAALAPGAAWAVTVAGDRTVRAWGTGGPSWLNGFAVAIGGQPAAVSVSSSGLLKILSMTDALLELQEYSDVSPSESHFFEMQARVRAAAFSPSGNVAVIACDDGTIRSFDVSTGEFGPVLTTGGQMVQAVAMASDRGPPLRPSPTAASGTTTSRREHRISWFFPSRTTPRRLPRRTAPCSPQARMAS